MNKAELVKRLETTDEFYVTFYGRGVKQWFQGTLTPGKTEKQLTPEAVEALQSKYGQDTVVVFDRTNDRLVAVKPQNVYRVDPLNVESNG